MLSPLLSPLLSSLPSLLPELTVMALGSATIAVYESRRVTSSTSGLRLLEPEPETSEEPEEGLLRLVNTVVS